ncbi:hypothetical protein CC86DRAFT_287819 [Ophiobolus disseminans]|uniref:DUF7820 domain-containing protein n=1 Tax=Ophiobolus disseminans TaxID=1469910 RepID=A0A6A7A7U9_9PLEO|nr:hypothetical protein CC86DRAFT_287819 [Ophiobolus disseminans]
MPSVSDGFRPADASRGLDSDRQDHDRNDTLQRHTSVSKPSDSDLRRTATRNSTAKVRDPVHNRGPSNPSPLAHRASVSSTASFATTSHGENPFELGTGPSHPYGMYPQHTMTRTLSTATAATDRQPHRSMSLQRPTHPYAMYSQSGLDEGLDDDTPLEPAQPAVPPIQTAIPLGFPGLGTGYHRVLGPDGEEQDIIGPDGHTEQLPPYSRFPDEGPTKASLAAEMSASRTVPVSNPGLDAEDPFNTPVSPVSPLSEDSFSAPTLPSAPLLPPITPARLPPQRPETQTGNVAAVTSTYSVPAQVPAEPSDSSSASLLSSEQSFSEKEKDGYTKIKTSWRKKKLWGRIPMGVVVVVLILLLVFAVALGAAIGTFVAKKHQNNRNKEGHRRPSGDDPMPQVTGTHGSLFDATPIPTPSGLALLPTGAFSLPLGIPQESNPGCLTQANQYSAWSCKLTFAPLVVTINTTQTNNGPRQLASMKTGSSVPDGAILYGLQSPNLSLEPMQLVLDLDYKAYGPAYHFAARYDKLVILRPDELSAGSGLSNRQDDKNFRQRFQVRPGDFPWYCFWNNTYIEGYIYVEDNSTAASFTAFPTVPPSGSPSASYDVAGFLATASSLASPFPITGPLPSGSSAAAATPAPVARRDSQNDASAPPRMPPYPRIVKIEERRTANSGSPYCQQMVLLDNGKIAPATNGNDGPKKIYLQELDPNYDDTWAARTSNAKRDDSLRERSDPSSACHCQWMFK